MTYPIQLGKIVKESIRFKGEICMEAAVSITTVKDLDYICSMGLPDFTFCFHLHSHIQQK